MSYYQKYIKYKKMNQSGGERKEIDSDIFFENKLINDPDKVTNEKEFIEFIVFLHKDSKKNKDEWENLKVDQYFESCAQAYIDHSNKNNDYLKNKTNIWSKVANILHNGKFYE